MTELIPLFVAIISLTVGSILGYYVRRSIAKRQARGVESKVSKLINEAKNEAGGIILKAKEKAIRAIDELKREEQRRRDEYSKTRKRAEEREELLDKKELDINGKDKDLKLKISKLEILRKK